MPSSPSEDANVYDVYLMRKSGLPIFAVCTGSEQCRESFERHSLHCGFISAVRSFGQEAFGQDEVLLIEMPKVKLLLKSNQELEVVMAFVLPSRADRTQFEKLLTAALEVFKAKWAPRLVLGEVSAEFFEGFKQDLQELGVVPGTPLASTRDIQFDEHGKLKFPPVPEYEEEGYQV
ncbi:MAG: hypothetical protein Kow0069_32820 [Promethearchaeota archaeon]